MPGEKWSDRDHLSPLPKLGGNNKGVNLQLRPFFLQASGNTLRSSGAARAQPSPASLFSAMGLGPAAKTLRPFAALRHLSLREVQALEHQLCVRDGERGREAA